MKHFVIYIFLWSVVALQAQTTDDFFNRGNEAYKKGDYQTAISQYEKALQSTKEAPELYFNLANAYYKLNRIAPSVYYYEKALKLNPSDEDITYNLALANQMKLDKIDQVPTGAIAKFKNSINRLFPYNTWAFLTLISAFAGLILFIIFLFTKNTNTKRLTFVAMFISLFLLIFNWLNADYGKRQAHLKYGIIFSPKTELMTEPNLTSDTVTVLHEGTKVKVLKQEDDWYLVQLPDGKKAWIPQSDLKII